MRALLAAAILVAAPAFADEADQHYAKALELKKQGKLDEAAMELEQAVKLRPDYAAAHFSLGVVYKMRNQIDKAIPHL